MVKPQVLFNEPDSLNQQQIGRRTELGVGDERGNVTTVSQGIIWGELSTATLPSGTPKIQVSV